MLPLVPVEADFSQAATSKLVTSKEASWVNLAATLPRNGLVRKKRFMARTHTLTPRFRNDMSSKIRTRPPVAAWSWFV